MLMLLIPIATRLVISVIFIPDREAEIAELVSALGTYHIQVSRHIK